MENSPFMVSVKLKTKISQGDSVEEINQSFKGQAVNLGGIFYIKYIESDENGEQGSVSFAIENDTIRLNRVGGDSLNLMFNASEDYLPGYITTLGKQLDVYTKTSLLSYDFQNSHQSGNLVLDYELFAGEGLNVGSFSLILQFNSNISNM